MVKTVKCKTQNGEIVQAIKHDGRLIEIISHEKAYHIIKHQLTDWVHTNNEYAILFNWETLQEYAIIH